MALTKIKGIIKEVQPIQNYGANDVGRRQTVIIMVPGYVDRYTQEKKSSDEFYEVNVFNDNIEKFGLNVNAENKVVEAELTLQGRTYPKKDGGTGYGVNVGLRSIAVIDTADATADQSKENDDDDVPF